MQSHEILILLIITNTYGLSPYMEIFIAIQITRPRIADFQAMFNCEDK